MAILKDENNFATQFMNEKNVNYEAVRAELENSGPQNKADFPSDDDDEKNPFGQNKPRTFTPADDQHLWVLLETIRLPLRSSLQPARVSLSSLVVK